MTSNTFIKIKRPTKLIPPTQQSSPVQEQPELEPTQPLEVEQPEQPAPPVKLESLAAVTPDESLFGTGWSMTELLNEFSSR